VQRNLKYLLWIWNYDNNMKPVLGLARTGLIFTGSWGAGTLSLRREQRRCGLRDRFCSAGLFCIFPFSVSLLLQFPLFAVLLNRPYPDPPVSAWFFPFSSAPWRGEGQPRGAFVAGCIQNQNKPQSNCNVKIVQIIFCILSLL